MNEENDKLRTINDTASAQDKLPKEIQGYTIVKRGRRGCIGVNAGAPNTVVCWMYTYDKTGVHSGCYCDDYAEALELY